MAAKRSILFKNDETIADRKVVHLANLDENDVRNSIYLVEYIECKHKIQQKHRTLVEIKNKKFSLHGYCPRCKREKTAMRKRELDVARNERLAELAKTNSLSEDHLLEQKFWPVPVANND